MSNTDYTVQLGMVPGVLEWAHQQNLSTIASQQAEIGRLSQALIEEQSLTAALWSTLDRERNAAQAVMCQRDVARRDSASSQFQLQECWREIHKLRLVAEMTSARMMQLAERPEVLEALADPESVLVETCKFDWSRGETVPDEITLLSAWEYDRYRTLCNFFAEHVFGAKPMRYVGDKD